MKKRIIIVLFIICIIVVVMVLGYSSKTGKNLNDYSVEDVYFINDKKQKIYAELYKPNKKDKVPIVIYSHGLGATYRAGSYYAEKLLENDIATLCIDYRGGSSRSKSDGKTTEMSIMTELEDLKLAIEEIRTWDFVDKDKIIVMGSSQGGLLSAYISVEDKDIRGAVLLYPALTLPDFINNRFPNDNNVPDEFPITSSITVGRNYITDIRDLNMFDMIKNETKKILILHGTDDHTVPVSVSERAVSIYKDSELHTIEGAGHGFSDAEVDIAMEYIIKYFKEIGVI